MILTKSEEERRSRNAARNRRKKRAKARKKAIARSEIPGTKEWLMKQPERWRGRLYYHYKRDPNGDVDGAFLDRLMDAQEERCAYCELPVGDDLVLEHVVPACQGGMFIKENIVIACYDCNDRKRARSVDRFLRELTTLRERI